ncbi:hypothetical protein N431DRAFT_25728 [Stipitochalara longipes BDJ]|nr:hypothetical protein N431DRAFT_25728 [Stipitochalara longipes BDJ]
MTVQRSSVNKVCALCVPSACLLWNHFRSCAQTQLSLIPPGLGDSLSAHPPEQSDGPSLASFASFVTLPLPHSSLSLYTGQYDIPLSPLRATAASVPYPPKVQLARRG